MTTVILVGIGIIIAAVAAFMMIFYGGSGFTSSSEKADATRLVGDGVQIQAAVQMYRVQEGKMPGKDAGVDQTALTDLVSHKYLTSVPAAAPGSDGGEWKIDYNYGIARSVVGVATDAAGAETRAMRVCRAARQQIGLTGDPLRCDAAGIPDKEPCCIMSADDAAA